MIDQKCAECGKEFEVDNTKRNWQSVILCSEECQRKRINRKSRESYIKQEWPQERICEWCNQKYSVYVHTQKANRKYCTRDCYLAKKRDIANKDLQKELRAKVCLSCGDAFIPNRHTPSRQKYCSATCFRREMWERHGRPLDKYSKELNAAFARIRRHVLKEYKSICQFCGGNIKPRVHHLDGEHKNNNYDNLTIACKSCHDSIHRIFLIKADGQWKVSGNIFKTLGLTGSININP